MLALLEAIRRRWHPLHQLRTFYPFRRVSRAVDLPVWWQLYGIRHPVRLRLMRNLSYLVNARTTEPEMVALGVHPESWTLLCLRNYGATTMAAES